MLSRALRLGLRWRHATCSLLETLPVTAAALHLAPALVCGQAPHSVGKGSWCEKGANNERRANRNNHRCSFCVGVGCLRPFCRVSLVLEQTGMADAASVDLDESENRGHDPG